MTTQHLGVLCFLGYLRLDWESCRIRPDAADLISRVSLAAAAVILRAQDAAKVVGKHYTVAFENDQVRVLKVHY